MNLNAMRRLDLWLGVPAVFGLKALYSVLRLNRRQHVEPLEVRNVLLIKCFGMGSLLLERPFLAEVRRIFPHAKIHLLTFQSNRALVELIPEIDHAYYLQTGSVRSFGISVVKNLRALQRKHPDISFDQEFFSKFTTFCSLVVGAPWRVGYFLQASWRRNAYTHNAYFNSSHHVTLVFLAQVGYALAPPDQINLDLPEYDPSQLVAALEPLNIPKSEVAVVHAVMEQWPQKRVVAVNVNSGELSHLRRWPIDNFYEMILKILHDEDDVLLVLIGSPSEMDYVQSLYERFNNHERVRNLCGVLTLPQLMIFLQKISLLISNDSGPIHMAASMGTDTISIFGPETPILYAPAGNGRHQVLYRNIFCSPCLNVYNNKLTTCTNNVCVNRLSVEAVVQAYQNR